jgi:hypothetical protein
VASGGGAQIGDAKRLLSPQLCGPNSFLLLLEVQLVAEVWRIHAPARGIASASLYDCGPKQTCHDDIEPSNTNQGLCFKMGVSDSPEHFGSSPTITKRGWSYLDFYWREDDLSGELIFRSPSAPLATSNNGSVLNYQGKLLPGPNLHRVESQEVRPR